MDWRITDAIVEPPGAERFYTEKLIRLDGGFLCFQLHADATAVTLSSSANTGLITFGSFNNRLKINRNVIQL